jgi:hypothetical protein
VRVECDHYQILTLVVHVLKALGDALFVLEELHRHPESTRHVMEYRMDKLVPGANARHRACSSQ